MSKFDSHGQLKSTPGGQKSATGGLDIWYLIVGLLGQTDVLTKNVTMSQEDQGGC